MIPPVDPPLAWLLAALVLGMAELVVPGVFLGFVAIAAAITAAIAFAVPALAVPAQLAAFGVWSLVAVAIGRRWSGEYPVGTEDALLNDRAGRLVGQVVTVEVALGDDRGRVRIGDGAWPARGAPAAVGARVRVVAVDAGIAVVEPLEP